MKKSNDLLRLIRFNSIDTKKAQKAQVLDVRNYMFVRLENMIKLLFSQGKMKWRAFSDIAPENMSNIDKAATNLHNQQKRLIASVLHIGWLYQYNWYLN